MRRRPSSAHEPRIALVIGNANYADEMKLANPANDAALIGGTLEKLGFEVILVTDAKQKQMQRAIVDFGDRLAKAGPDAVGLFYYAGHGLQLEGRTIWCRPMPTSRARSMSRSTASRPIWS